MVTRLKVRKIQTKRCVKCKQCKANNAIGNSLYCSESCKAVDTLSKRAKKLGLDFGQFPDGIPSLAHYHARPDLYAVRREPDTLNWGDWMSDKQLAVAGLKENRVIRPGDWDRMYE